MMVGLLGLHGKWNKQVREFAQQVEVHHFHSQIVFSLITFIILINLNHLPDQTFMLMHLHCQIKRKNLSAEFLRVKWNWAFGKSLEVTQSGRAFAC